jgi:superfamily II DNA helicase RecQ
MASRPREARVSRNNGRIQAMAAAGRVCRALPMSAGGAPRATISSPGEAWPGGQSALYGQLMKLRNELARESRLPACCIFADKTLIALAQAHPTTESEMLRVSGVGPAKLEKYGEAFLRLLREG